MLVLSRRIGQRILIPELDITIEVLHANASGTQVKLGFSAPRHVAIVREEVEELRAAQDAAKLAASKAVAG